ncbi:hypothetical protein SAMN05421666_3519 [Roseovarius nanhaiticus]|uniref:Uncharacterized protein n=1 Tax=Roseovarius nanhaiticus TaxID=573024 RepID=A0A1N7HNB5_9RHOB|nr:hypothetical protein [Roseovarius nanhaiticus]SEL39584.1 hypothetical protein SAMN05216208_0020 [Roseovarius nanhaiticus]SIS26347.1 hypothetical protein SAMN05421666_3519 [Roseovarius nanhaiticus]
MKTDAQPSFGFRRRCLLPSVLLVSTLCTQAWAQWPTTEWVVMNAEIEKPHKKYEEWDTYIAPLGERGEIAQKHETVLKAASIWYQSLGFPEPVQKTEDDDLNVGPGEAYLGHLKRDPGGAGSSHTSDGEMLLTSNPGVLSADTPIWTLMKASAVHELFHAIQDKMSPPLTPAMRVAPQNPQCPGPRDELDTNLSWLIEGTAAMVQIRWLEGTEDVSWDHPFKGSHRAAWVQTFDQSLHMGALPAEHMERAKRPEMTALETVSWYCDYGTWYFWYAVGDMIGRTDGERVAFTRYIFEGNEPWADGGIVNVDRGLKAAAANYNAIRAYSAGLYDLFPQFVAQYLTKDRFYGDLQQVDLGAPDIHRTTSALTGGPLKPLAARAWRVRVQLPQDASPIPYKVRFTLDAADGTDRNDLHLIVEDTLIKKPMDPTAPYTDVEQIGPSGDGVADYLVRVANVAEDAAETENAEFSMRIEVEGYYGNEVTAGMPSGDVGAIAGELPPGFAVRGPPQWSCSGGASSRALFNLVTPQERGRDIERAVPDFVRSMTGVADQLDIITQKAERGGVVDKATAQQLHDKLAEGRATLDSTNPAAKDAASKARARQATKINATFVGSNDDEMCQMLLTATLKDPKGGPQSVAGAVDKARYPKDEAPVFNLEVLQQAFFDAARRGFQADPDQERESWVACTMTAEEQQKVRKYAARIGCEPVLCSPGRLTLEAAEQGRIAGTFEFDILRERTSGRCDTPLGRDKAVGHFNVHSTDDGYDDDSLFGGVAISGVPLGLKGSAAAAGAMPGAPIFESGEAMSDKLGDALDSLDLSDF